MLFCLFAAVFLKDMNGELEKQMRQVEKEEITLDDSQQKNPSTEESIQDLPIICVLDIEECMTLLSPSDVITEYKEVLKQVLLGDEVYGPSDVITLLKMIKFIMQSPEVCFTNKSMVLLIFSWPTGRVLV